MSAPLASEQVGQFFFDSDRIEYSEFGSGDRWVVLIHGQLMPRTMHGPLARVLAADGFHVVTVDLLGHGRSDKPEDPKEYSMSAFGEQVLALLDHLSAERAIVGGTSLGANVGLEVAAAAPERVQGLVLEMPVLDNALEAGILAFAPLLFIARFFPFGIRLLAGASRGGEPCRVTIFWRGFRLVIRTRCSPVRSSSTACRSMWRSSWTVTGDGPRSAIFRAWKGIVPVSTPFAIRSRPQLAWAYRS